MCNRHGYISLERIQHKRERTQTARAGTNDIGGSDVAAAAFAYIFGTKQSHQQVAEGNGAKQVAEDRGGGKQETRHDVVECSRVGGAGRAPLPAACASWGV